MKPATRLPHLFSAGQDFASELDSPSRRVEGAPRMYPVVWRPDIRRALMRRRFPYALYFTEIENGIEIIASARRAKRTYHSRKPGYWLARL